MTPLERLARAVLAFHRGGQWTGTDRNEWVMLTGEEDATTKTLCDLARRLLVPGAVCGHCGEPIEAENAVDLPHIGEDGVAVPGAVHRECITRMLIGGINHQRGTCQCGGGPDDPDPPHLTRRQAAIAAWAYHEGRSR
jgi:hypothetical protein